MEGGVTTLYLHVYSVSNFTGWRPVVAAYQWRPFAFCAGNHVFDSSQTRQICKRKQKEFPQQRLVKFFACKAKGKEFPEPHLMLTSLHSMATTFHAHIIKYRNKRVQIAVLMFTNQEKVINCNEIKHLTAHL